MNYPFDLGQHTRQVTKIKGAQVWFDRGLVWLYGYNHEEAVTCWEYALEADPDLAWANWGIAYALGPNYNKPWYVFTDEERAPTLARMRDEIAKGLSKTAPGALEHRLFEALALRTPEAPDLEDFQPHQDAYTEAMRAIYADHPGDLDLACLFAEALMTRTPWQLWDLKTGEAVSGSSATEARAVLETAFQQPQAWQHPGLLHMYVHLMEMSPTPEAALRHGDSLTGLVPGSGHLMHMATHIDMLCGDYANVVARNHTAAEVDAVYKDYAGGENFYALYRIHNLHFEVYGAMFLAQPSAALAAAAKLREEVPDEVVRVYPDLFEAFVATRPHVLIRFGMWAQILEEPIPEDTKLFSFTHALILYARAVALANLGRADEATAEVARFDAALAAIPETRMLFQNKARDVLAVAAEMMRGEVAYKAGDIETGLAHLRRAVELDDGLMYEEPWSWPQPARHALGALLMQAGQVEEAEAVYRADLGLDPTLPRAQQHPGNIWSLHGLHECLSRRGEAVERLHVAQQLARAQARAEVPVQASCACRVA